MPVRSRWRGSLAFIFDADEHTGTFTGIRRFMQMHGNALNVAGAMIGYPGNERIAIGGRGFLRARIKVHGHAAHSGSSSRTGTNAVWRAARLIDAVQAAPLPTDARSGFPLPPRISVTAVEGGTGFSVVPDLCAINVDIRLTPTFDRETAAAMLGTLVRDFDAEAIGVRASDVEWIEGWPAYHLDADSPLIRALRKAAHAVTGKKPPTDVVGPSSVANFLYGLGVPATNGYGVTCENIHATDERIAVDTIAPVFDTYRLALGNLLLT